MKLGDQGGKMGLLTETGYLKFGKGEGWSGQKVLVGGPQIFGGKRWWDWIGTDWELGVNKATWQRSAWKPSPFTMVPHLSLSLGQRQRGQQWKVQKEGHDCTNHRRGNTQDQGSQQGVLTQTKLHGTWWEVPAVVMKLHLQTSCL